MQNPALITRTVIGAHATPMTAAIRAIFAVEIEAIRRSIARLAAAHVFTDANSAILRKVAMIQRSAVNFLHAIGARVTGRTVIGEHESE